MASPTPRDPHDSDPDGRAATILVGTASSPSAGEELRPGTELDHFRVMRLLGAGGMGQIYLARDVKLGRKVALKLIHRQRLGDDPGAIQMFLEEARATARFNHPHIVTIYAAGEHEGQPYVALEFIEGEDLQSRIAAGAMAVHDALNIGRAIADALVEAHRLGILHRDLKPDNIVIGRDGRPRVVDFGLALAVRGPDDEALETEGRVVGTPLYMAPEAWLGEAPSPAVDIWAFGAVLFQMLTGGAYYLEATRARAAMRLTLSETPSPRVREHRDVPPGVDDLVAECLAKDPELRPTAAELVTRIDELLTGGDAKQLEEDQLFRGLLAFDERHAASFFGREAEVASFLERLRGHPILPVVGPSGAGKSSFLRAGVLPRLRERGYGSPLVLRPGPEPFRALATRLVGPSTGSSSSVSSGSHAPTDGDQVAELAARLQAEPRALSVLLRGLVERRGAPLALVVDQLEELFTLQNDEEVQRAFMVAICTAADDYADPLRVMFTVRDDYLGRIVVAPEVREAMSSVTVLRPLDALTMAEGLRRTAALAGYRFEDDDLPEEMVREVAQGAGALPLVQFAAEQLWRQRDRERKVLTRRAYDAMGGVTGALASHADGVLDGLTERQLRVARHILLRLVTPDQTRRIVARDELIIDGQEDRDVLDRFINARLVITRRARRGEPPTCELAHEALIERWETLARWLEESRDDRALLAEIDDAAALWDKRGRRGAELWQGDALRDARRFLDRAEAVPERARAFLIAGEQRERGRRLRGRIALGAIFVGLTSVALVLSYQKQRADRAAATASEQLEQTRLRKAEADRQAATAAFTGRSMLEARALLRASLEGRDHVLTRALWWQLQRDPELWTRDLDTVLYGGSFSPDGTKLALAAQDRLVYEADVATRQLWRYRGHRDQVRSVAYVEGGTALVSATWQGRVWRFDRQSDQGTELESLHSDRLVGLRVSPDQRWLVTHSRGRADRLWQTAAWTPRSLPGEPYDTLGVGPAGGVVIGVKSDGELRVLDAEAGRIRATVPIGVRELRSIAVRRDGSMVAVGDDQAEIRVVDLAKGTVAHQLNAPLGPVTSLDFSPDGELLASSSRTGPPRLWEASSGRLLHTLPEAQSTWTRFSFDGRLLAYGSLDRVTVLRVASLLARPRARLHRAVYAATFSPNGQHVATGSFDGVIEVWNVARAEVEYRHVVGSDTVHAIVFSRDGSALIAASGDGVITKLGVATGRIIWRARMGQVLEDLRISPDGTRLLSTGGSGTIAIQDVETGAIVDARTWTGRARRRAVFAGDDVVFAGDDVGRLTRWRIGEAEPSLLRPLEAGQIFGLAVGADQAVYVGVERGRLLRVGELGDGEIEVLRESPELRFLDVDVGTDGSWMWADSGGTCGRATGTEASSLHRSNMEMNQSRVSADGQLALCAGDDGSLRLWDLQHGRPLWHSAGLLSGGRLHALGRRMSLGGVEEKLRPYETTIDAEVAQVDETPSGAFACVVRHDGETVYWATAERKARARHRVSGRVQTVLATAGGCLVGTEAGVVRVAAGADQLLDRPARQLARDADGKPFALVEGAVVELEGARREVAVSPYVTAVARLAELEIHGYRDGNIKVARRADGRASPDFAQTPSSRVVSIVAGPPGTVVVGFENGLVGMWDLEAGQRIAGDYLHGPARFLRLEGQRLLAASELGQHFVWDLSVFYRPYCELLAEVWREVPVVTVEGRVSLREPDANHPCRRGR